MEVEQNIYNYTYKTVYLLFKKKKKTSKRDDATEYQNKLYPNNYLQFTLLIVYRCCAFDIMLSSYLFRISLRANVFMKRVC